MKYRPPLYITIYSSVPVLTDSSLAFLNKLRRRSLNITFSLRPGHGAVFVHLENAIFLEVQIYSSIASPELFCNESRYVKRWWGVTGFQGAISGTTPSLDITLRGWNLTSFTSSLDPADHLNTYGRHGCDSNLCNCSRQPFCRLDHSQFLYSFVHNTAAPPSAKVPYQRCW